VDVRRRPLAGRDLLLHDGVGFAGLFAEHLEGHSATEDAEHLTRTKPRHNILDSCAQ